MELFKKRETILQSMTFMSIIAALNTVLLFLTSVLPYLVILLTLILPFASVIVCVTCKKRFYPIYAAVTIGLCFIVSYNSIGNIIFYILPSLLSGFIFGFCIDKEISPAYSILYSGFTYVISSYLNMIFCQFVLDEPIHELFFTIFNLNDFSYRAYLIPLFIFVIGIIQSTLSYAFIEVAMKRVGIKQKDEEDGNFLIFTTAFILLTLGSILVKPDMYLMFLGFTIYCYIYTEYDLFKSNKKVFVASQALGIVTMIMSFGLFYDYIKKEFALCILLIPMIIVVIIALVNNCFVKKEK